MTLLPMMSKYNNIYNGIKLYRPEDASGGNGASGKRAAHFDNVVRAETLLFMCDDKTANTL